MLWNYLSLSWDIPISTRTICMTTHWSFPLPGRHRRQAPIAERALEKAEHLEETKGILKRSVNMLLMITESDSLLKMKFYKSINQRMHANNNNWIDPCCYMFSYLFTWRVPGENTHLKQEWALKKSPCKRNFEEFGCKYLLSYFTGFLFLMKWHLRKISKIFLFKILIAYDFPLYGKSVIDLNTPIIENAKNESTLPREAKQQNKEQSCSVWGDFLTLFPR